MTFPGALPAPHKVVTLINATRINNAVNASRDAFFNRCIQPHRHAHPPKIESLLVVCWGQKTKNLPKSTM
ncbi:MAG: hypothetical protein M0O96_11310 [Desulforhopalus sp.]|nr:hypothetical protein [Desulforhopalus sp.]